MAVGPFASGSEALIEGRVRVQIIRARACSVYLIGCRVLRAVLESLCMKKACVSERAVTSGVDNNTC